MELDLAQQALKVFKYVSMIEGELRYLDAFSKDFTIDNFKESLKKVRSISDSIREDLDLIEDRIQAEIRVIEKVTPSTSKGTAVFVDQCLQCGRENCSPIMNYCSKTSTMLL